MSNTSDVPLPHQLLHCASTIGKQCSIQKHCLSTRMQGGGAAAWQSMPWPDGLVIEMSIIVNLDSYNGQTKQGSRTRGGGQEEQGDTWADCRITVYDIVRIGRGQRVQS